MFDETSQPPTNAAETRALYYWRSQRELWRNEPEISIERQQELTQRLQIRPNLQQANYPFKGLKLSRADVEWLLSQRRNEATNDGLYSVLDLRGVNESTADGETRIDWSGLPLNDVLFGLNWLGWVQALDKQRQEASANLTQVNLQQALLQNAELNGVNLQSADLQEADLQYAKLRYTQLQAANLQEADLQGAVLDNADLTHASLISCKLQQASLREARLEGVYFDQAILSDTDFRNANLQRANFTNVTLQNVNFQGANLQYANLLRVDLSHSNLANADLQHADLRGANLQFADLTNANLQHADLTGAKLHHAVMRHAQLQATNLTQVDLTHADLCGATCNEATLFAGAKLSARTMRFADTIWGGVDLVPLDWSPVVQLGDETLAQAKFGKRAHVARIERYQEAERAYRRLSTALREQGLIDEASRFAYRAQLCRRQVFRLERKRGQYLWSALLDLLAGYGYRPQRSFIAYVAIIALFGVIYFLLGQHSHPLTGEEAFVVSMTAFHGRGFFAEQFRPGDPQAFAAAIEALVGLIIEVSFIATFTQRYLGR